MQKKGNIGLTLLLVVFLLIFFGIFIKTQQKSLTSLTGFVTYDPALFTTTFIDPTPADQNVTTASQVTIKINVNPSADNAWLEWDGVNESMQGANQNWHLDKIGTGQHTYRAYVNNSQGNYSATETRTVTLNVSQPIVNQANLTLGAIPNQTIAEDNVFALNLQDYTITNQNPVTYTQFNIDPTFATCVITSTTYLNCTLVKNINGITTLTVNASASTISATTSFTLIINPVNDAPTLIKNFTNITFTNNESYTLNLTTYFTDVENDNLSYGANPGPELLAATNASVVTLSAAKPGTTNVTFYANDSMNTTFSAPVLVIVTGNVTVIKEEKKEITIPNQEWDKNTVLQLDLQPYFTMAGTGIQYSTKGLTNIAATFNGHVASLRPAENWYGSETVVFIATGSAGEFPSNDVVLTVKNTEKAPELKTPLPSFTFTRNNTKTTLNLNDYFTDPEHEQLTYTANASNEELHLNLENALLTIELPKKSTTLTQADVTVKAKDPKQNTAEGKITITFGEDLQRKNRNYGLPILLSTIAFIAILVFGGYKRMRNKPFPALDPEKHSSREKLETLKELFTPKPKSDRYKKEVIQTAEAASVLGALIRNCNDHLTRTSLQRQKENIQRVQRFLEKEMDEETYRRGMLTLKETRGALHEIKSMTKDELLSEELEAQIKIIEGVIKNVTTKYK